MKGPRASERKNPGRTHRTALQSYFCASPQRRVQERRSSWTPGAKFGHQVPGGFLLYL
jgi:hypothetical protein